jgi:hypothetical protein
MAGHVLHFVTLSLAPKTICMLPARQDPFHLKHRSAPLIAVNIIFNIGLPAHIKIVVLLLAKRINNQTLN